MVGNLLRRGVHRIKRLMHLIDTSEIYQNIINGKIKYKRNVLYQTVRRFRSPANGNDNRSERYRVNHLKSKFL